MHLYLNIATGSLNELQIAFVCRETLKVCTLSIYHVVLCWGKGLVTVGNEEFKDLLPWTFTGACVFVG